MKVQKNKDPLRLPTYASSAMQSSAHRLTMKLKADYVAKYELTVLQWQIIGFVSETGEDGISISELAGKIDTSLPFVTKTVSTLEKRGIVLKQINSNDSRNKRVLLNRSYLEKVQEIEAGLRELLQFELFKVRGITRSELENYITVLGKILK